MVGYYQYRGVNARSFMPPVTRDELNSICKKSDIPNKSKDLLDMIYAVDETGFPAGAIQQYLSDGIRDEVRKFIEDNLLRDNPDVTSSSFPSELTSRLREVDEDFQFKVMRNRFEDIETYENRIRGYIEEIQSSERGKAAIAKYLKKDTKEEDTKEDKVDEK